MIEQEYRERVNKITNQILEMASYSTLAHPGPEAWAKIQKYTYDEVGKLFVDIIEKDSPHQVYEDGAILLRLETNLKGKYDRTANPDENH